MSEKSKKIKCDTCQDFFTSIEDFDEHLAQVHFMCVWCNKNDRSSFLTLLLLLQHIWEEHPTTSW